MIKSTGAEDRQKKKRKKREQRLFWQFDEAVHEHNHQHDPHAATHDLEEMHEKGLQEDSGYSL